MQQVARFDWQHAAVQRQAVPLTPQKAHRSPLEGVASRRGLETHDARTRAWAIAIALYVGGGRAQAVALRKLHPSLYVWLVHGVHASRLARRAVAVVSPRERFLYDLNALLTRSVAHQLAPRHTSLTSPFPAHPQKTKRLIGHTAIVLVTAHAPSPMPTRQRLRARFARSLRESPHTGQHG